VSRADQLRAQARRVQGRPPESGEEAAAEGAPETVPPPAATGMDRASTPRSGRRAPSVRTKPVRRTVDLSPTDHAGLTNWCSTTAVEIGAARVTGQDVLRALVSRLLHDEDLAEQVRADLAVDMAL